MSATTVDKFQIEVEAIDSASKIIKDLQKSIGSAKASAEDSWNWKSIDNGTDAVKEAAMAFKPFTTSVQLAEESVKVLQEVVKNVGNEFGFTVDSLGRLRDSLGKFVSDAKLAEAGLLGVKNRIAELIGEAKEIDKATKSVSDFSKKIQTIDPPNQKFIAMGDSMLSALNPMNLMSGALQVFAGGILSSVGSSIMTLLNPMTYLTAGFDALTIAAESLYSIISGAFSAAFTAAGMAVDGVVAVFSTLGSAAMSVGSALMDVGTTIGGLLLTAFDGLLAAAGATASALLEVGSAAASALGEAVRVSGDFEQSMANVKSMGVESEDTFQRMREAAIKLGADTSLSSSQAADALYSLRSAGFSSEESILALEGTGKLAEATMSDLQFTAEAVGATIKQFGMEASDAGRVSNVFAAAIQNSALTMDRAANGMKYAGVIAGALKIPFEETTAALMVLNNAGIKGEMAGTALRSGLSKLVDPSKESAAAIQALGLSVKDTNPALVGITGVVAALEKAGMTATDAVKIFGVEAGPAMANLVGGGAQALTDFQAKITGTNAALDMSKVQLDTFSGALKIFEGSWESLQIVIGGAFLPVLKQVVIGASEIVNALTTWIQTTGLATAAMAAFNGIVSAVQSVVSMMAPSVSTLGTMFQNLGTTIAGSLTTFGEWIASTAKTSLAIEGLAKTFGTIIAKTVESIAIFAQLVAGSKAVNDAWNAMRTAAQSLISDIGIMATQVQTSLSIWIQSRQAYLDLSIAAAAVGSVFQSVTAVLISLGGAFFSTVQAVVDFATGTNDAASAGTSFIDILVSVANAAKSVSDSIVSGLSSYAEWVTSTDTVSAALNAVSIAFTAVTSVVTAAVAVFNTVSGGVGAAAASLADFLTGLQAFVKQTETGIKFDFGGAIKAGIVAGIGIINAAANDVAAAVSKMVGSFNADSVASTITAFIASIRDNIISGFTTMSADGAIAQAFVDVFGFLASVAEKVTGPVGDMVSGVFALLKQSFDDNAAALGTQMGTIFEPVVTAAIDALAGIVDAITATISGAESMSGSLSEFFKSGIDAALPNIKEAFDMLGKSLGEFVTAALDAAGLSDFGKKFVEPILASLQAGNWDDLKKALGELLKKAISEAWALFVAGVGAALDFEVFGVKIRDGIIMALGLALTGLGALVMALPVLATLSAGIVAAVVGAAASFGPLILAAGLAVLIGYPLGNAIAEAFPEGLKSIGEAAADFMKGIAAFFTGEGVDPITNAVAAIASAIGTASVAIGPALTAIKEGITKAAVGMADGVVDGAKAIGEALDNIGQLFGAAVVDFSVLVGDIAAAIYDKFMAFFTAAGELTAAVEMWLDANIAQPINNFASSVVETIANIGTAIYDGVAAVFEFMTTMPEDAYTWGANIIQSWVDGIMATIENAKAGIASAVDWVFGMFKGQSPPKEGPLQHIDQWGSNVAAAWSDSFVARIQSSIPSITSAVAAAGSAMGGLGKLSGVAMPANLTSAIKGTGGKAGGAVGAPPGFAAALSPASRQPAAATVNAPINFGGVTISNGIDMVNFADTISTSIKQTLRTETAARRRG